MIKPLVAITGASSGIGEATARAFSAQGHPLLLMARRLDRMAALGLPNTMCRCVDVRDRGAIAQAVKDAEAEYGPVDCLFNNAGVARLGDIGEQNPEEWDESIDINIKGVMNALHPFINSMKVYCGSKYFVHAISESLRGYLAPHDVRVIVISPGIIETEVLDHVTDPNTLKAYKDNKVRIGGGISADHVANMILFAYQMPQNVLIQEMVVTPTRQEF
jgi:NADP-dependent 3-hydroxy acid dehydrogenase YdfG